jgi:hypothetical protein
MGQPPGGLEAAPFEQRVEFGHVRAFQPYREHLFADMADLFSTCPFSQRAAGVHATG